MTALTTPNADLEQSVFKANVKEARLRRRAIIMAFVPAVVGALWLLYCLIQITTWQSRFEEVQTREAQVQQRETESSQKVADADAKRTAAEARVGAALAQEKAAKERTDDIQQRLVKVRDEIGSLATLLSEVSSARAKASKLAASEAVESQLTEIRTTLGRTLGRIEQEIDTALPAAEQKTRVYLFVADEAQRTAAKALVPLLENAGFDVAAIAKNSERRVENTEVRYFRDRQDTSEAIRVQTIVAAQPGLGDCKIVYANDPAQASGSRKLQVWFGKPTPPAR